MISIILFRPQVAGNVGAIARAMSNFGLSRLVVIDPRCDILSKEAQDRAKHAKKILHAAQVGDEGLLDQFDLLVATTSQLGSDFNIPRSPLSPRQLAKKVARSKRKVAILFGPEGEGLSNKEILRSDFSVTIPTAPAQPVMNLSHAATVVMYELFLASTEKKIGENILPISKREKDELMKTILETLDKLKWRTPGEKETQKRLWKRIVGKSMPTRREGYALFGFFKRIK